MFFNFERYQSLFGKMLYFGSGAEFDKRNGICSISEEDAGNGIPATDYGLYKYIINKSIQHSKTYIICGYLACSEGMRTGKGFYLRGML